MEKIKTKTNNGHINEFKAAVTAHQAPSILEAYFDDNGDRMYECADGRVFNADVFDRIWNIPKGKILPKGSKGDNPSSKYSYLK